MKLTTAGPIEVLDEKQALDATIVFVRGDRMVNLSVTDHGGRIHFVRCCILRQEDDMGLFGEGTHYCEWMPHQASQAAKAAPAPEMSDAVNACNKSFANVIDSLDELRNGTDGATYRLIREAITQAQTPQMWAVKAITWSA